MVRTATLAAFAITISAFAVACGGGDSKTVTRTVAIEPTRRAVPIISGDGELDQVIDAALRVDDIALAGLTGYQRVPCKRGTPEEIGIAPECRPGEQDGTGVEVLASSGCQDGWIRPEQVPDAFRLSLSPEQPQLVVVTKPRLGAGVFGEGFGALQAAVLRSRQTGDGQPAGVSLHVFHGRVVWIQASCGPLSELTAPKNVDSVIFDPKNPQPSGSSTPSSSASGSPVSGATPGR